MVNQKLCKRMVRVAQALCKLNIRTAADINDLNQKLNRVSQAINSGKLNPEQLQKASQMVIQLTQQIIDLSV